MGFELDIFKGSAEPGLDADYLEWLVDEHSIDIHRHFAKLWDYYANPAVEISEAGSLSGKVNESGRCYVQAQEYGLPARITGFAHSG